MALRYAVAQRRHVGLVAALQVLYGLLLVAYLIEFHSWPGPDVVAVAFLGFAVVAARGLGFLWDWSPFILLLLCYVALTGAAGGLEGRAHVGGPIAADRVLGLGQVPTVWLQEHLWHSGAPRWYDYLAVVLYPLHFFTPLLLAFVLWQWRPALYWRFVSSYLALCYAAFATYLIYPAAPPWWAANERRLPPVYRLLGLVPFGRVGEPVILVERFFRPNPVAAIPSLHAAAPVLVWLVGLRVWRRWGWLLLVYPLAMAWAVVYLGEHYAVDVLAGWLYALAAFCLVWGLWDRVWRQGEAPPNHRQGQFGPHEGATLSNSP